MKSATKPQRGRILSIAGAIVTMSLAAPVAAATTTPGGDERLRELQSLSIEELLAVEVVSASRQASSYAETPAAVSVITKEQIAVSGAASIPELLRLVPGLQVARFDAGRWAISARGFNSLYSNKLLVLVDGRSIYNELFSGVYWELLEIPLAEIERIEVIRGPGGATWGANAVNGVINILTRSAEEAQPLELIGEVGTDVPEWGVAARGSTQWERSALRLSGVKKERGEFSDAEGKDTDNLSEILSAQGRFEWRPAANQELRIQAGALEHEYVQNYDAPIVTPPYSRFIQDSTQSESQFLLARWRSTSGEGERSTWTAQLNATRTEFDTGYFEDEAVNLDAEFSWQHRLSPSRTLTTGLGARYLESRFEDTPVVSGTENDKNLELYSAFAQFDWAPDASPFSISFGAKLEHNDFTDYEFQPSLRGGWQVAENAFAWAALSRAVKTPDRVQSFVTIDVAVIPSAPLPTYLVAQPNEDLASENLTAYEIGLRGRVGSKFSYDLALYHHDYDDLAANLVGQPFPDTVQGAPVFVLPLLWASGAEGEASGVEAAVNIEIGDRSSLRAQFSYVDFALGEEVFGEFAIYTFGQEGTTPKRSAGLQWNYRPDDSWSIGVEARHVSGLEFFNELAGFGPERNNVDSYTEADLTIVWQPTERVRLKLAGKDLLDSRHLEFIEYTFSDDLNYVTRRALFSAAISF